MPSGVRNQAFTFIELLVACAIALLIAGGILALYRVAALTAASQQVRLNGPHAARGALRALQHDLACMQTQESDPACALTLTDDEGKARLSFCTTMSGAEGEMTWPVVHHVVYQIMSDGAFARTAQPLAGPGSLDPPTTQRLVRSVQSFRVELDDGIIWQRRWPTAAGLRARRARAVLHDAAWGPADDAPRVEFLLPTGLSITSRLLRTASTTP